MIGSRRAMAARRARLPRARWRAAAPPTTMAPCPARLCLRPPARQLATATAPRAAGTPPLLTAGDLEAMTVTQLREHIQKHLPEMAAELDLRRGGASKQQLMEDVLRVCGSPKIWAPLCQVAVWRAFFMVLCK